MSDKKTVSPTVSALREVLARSAAITNQLDLKQGSWWEYTGFDQYAKALQAEYQTLVGLRTDIRKLLAPIPDDLRGDTATELGKLVETFGKVEAAMLKLEAVQVANKTVARNNHKNLVTAQIKIAQPLKDQVRDAVNTAVAETDASNLDDALKKDQATVKDLKERMDAVLLLDLGEADVTPPGKLNGAIRQCFERVNTMKKPLTPSQRDSLSDFARFETEYKDAASKETARKQREKGLKDWAVALKAATTEVDNWRNNAEIAEARTILHTLQPFTKNVQALDRAIQAFPTFDPGKPDPDGLRDAVAKVTLAGTPLVDPAHAAVASRDTDINAAVAAVTLVVAEKSPPGTRAVPEGSQDGRRENPWPDRGGSGALPLRQPRHAAATEAPCRPTEDASGRGGQIHADRWLAERLRPVRDRANWSERPGLHEHRDQPHQRLHHAYQSVPGQRGAAAGRTEFIARRRHERVVRSDGPGHRPAHHAGMGRRFRLA